MTLRFAKICQKAGNKFVQPELKNRYGQKTPTAQDFFGHGDYFAGMGLSLLVRAILIPRRFGFTVTADELTAALTIVLVVDTIVREGAKFSLVPLFVTSEKEMTRTEYRRFTNSLLFFLIGVGFGIFVLIELLAPWIAGGLLRKSTIDAQKGTTLLAVMCPIDYIWMW